MNTFLHFLPKLKNIPLITSWELAELAEMKGRQELYTKQSPQRLKRMREFSMIESAVLAALYFEIRTDFVQMSKNIPK